MKATLRSAAILLVLGTAPSLAWAQEYSRGGRACLEELCVGDGLDALAGIAWDTARSPGDDAPSRTRTVGRGESNRIANRYRGNVSGIIGYLADGRFDKGALAGMAGVEAACETQSMQGKYTTASGNETLVLVSMAADPADPSIQSWQVRRITRRVAGVATREQADEAKAALETRYAPFTSRNRAPADDMLQVNSYSGFQYTLSAPSVPNEGGVLKQHRACGGNGGGPVSLD